MNNLSRHRGRGALPLRSTAPPSRAGHPVIAGSELQCRPLTGYASQQSGPSLRAERPVIACGTSRHCAFGQQSCRWLTVLPNSIATFVKTAAKSQCIYCCGPPFTASVWIPVHYSPLLGQYGFATAPCPSLSRPILAEGVVATSSRQQCPVPRKCYGNNL